MTVTTAKYPSKRREWPRVVVVAESNRSDIPDPSLSFGIRGVHLLRLVYSDTIGHLANSRAALLPLIFYEPPASPGFNTLTEFYENRWRGLFVLTLSYQRTQVRRQKTAHFMSRRGVLDLTL